MGWMSEIDIMRQEGAREVEDFEAFGYDRPTSKVMSEIVKGAEEATAQEFNK
jgi:hypothetical protein